ncbi:hypothetical protein DFQ01_109125 [Paenibacillus cellulosilyticus]|uniref:Uncharacterized protein n=1 Tax=Paenibacillus cellulosilyticus TaxID=375489 RepID=A0A2V2YVK9_9BACL|nr:hypothetical protein [Paenibacillus cellulosilyticus]PWW02500.1 hypothetical protein DFQ01_109125 [Paenibacillus cellulosilyticus]QKS47202.1 hypothetical protein HUB94_22440 [Paenibacillus cellulosilyticus]
MEDYWFHVLENLNAEELGVLRILLENDAIAKIKSMSNPQLQEECCLSESRYRTTISRLNAMKFIEVTAGTKEHTVFINSYGRKAVYHFKDESL